jgi:hypothetical protein
MTAPIPIRPRQPVTVRLERFDNRVLRVNRLTALGLEQLDAWRADGQDVTKLYRVMQTTLPELTLGEIKRLEFDEMLQILEVAYADIATVEALAGKGGAGAAAASSSPIPEATSSAA